MTNEQIMRDTGYPLCWRLPGGEFEKALDAARADERAKVVSEFADKVPKEGTLEWAAMKHRKGEKVQWMDDEGATWPCEFANDGDGDGELFAHLDGWSVVLAEPMTWNFMLNNRGCWKHAKLERWADSAYIYIRQDAVLCIRNAYSTMDFPYFPTQEEVNLPWFKVS